MRKIINNTLRIFVISAVLISAVLMFIVSCVQISFTTREDMKSRMMTLEACLNHYQGEDKLDIIKNTYDSAVEMRVTLINPDGDVLYDNKADISEMDNHFTRPEFSEAMEMGESESTRKSKTLGRRIYCCAVKLDNGDILRIARPMNAAILMGMSIAPIILIILALLILAAFPVSKKLARHIMELINNVDLSNVKDAEVYDELKPFLSRIADENEQKAQAEKMRREFTANVSHELKTPLTTISGYAQMINNGMAKTEDVSEFSKKIEKESDRLLTLIDDIINLSNLDECGGVENPETIDLSLIAEEAISVLEKAAKEKNIQIFYSRTPTYIQGNATLIGELVYNLLDNAIKYNNENGKITVFVGENINGAELYVKDTGIGIPEEDTERIFERFYRVDKSHSKKVGGTGLGLSIVKHVCACHNADIRVKSKIGHGTTVYVTFPSDGKNNFTDSRD